MLLPAAKKGCAGTVVRGLEGSEKGGQEKRKRKAWGESKCSRTDHLGKHGVCQPAQEVHGEGHPQYRSSINLGFDEAGGGGSEVMETMHGHGL